MKQLLRFINKKIQYNATIWNVGITHYEPDILLTFGYQPHIRWVQHSFGDRWFADPFILSVSTDEYELLVEEFDEHNQKGKISKMTVDRHTMVLKSLKTIFELDTHLSFPNFCKNGNNIFIYPENAQQGNLVLYRYFQDTETVEKVSTLIDSEIVVDAALHEIDNKFFIFATYKSNRSKNEVAVFESSSWDGKYILHKMINVEPGTARGAGNIFTIKNKMIRPSQDCSKGYGKGIILSELKYDGNIFSIKEKKRIYASPNDYYNEGIHTFNVYENLVAVDGYRFKKPLLARTLNRIRDKFGI